MHRTTFTFQYGSIKREPLGFLIEQKSTFTFQYGSIKSTELLQKNNLLLVFTFQYGSIKSTYQDLYDNINGLIYIPIWFD